MTEHEWPEWDDFRRLDAGVAAYGEEFSRWRSQRVNPPRAGEPGIYLTLRSSDLRAIPEPLEQIAGPTEGEEEFFRLRARGAMREAIKAASAVTVDGSGAGARNTERVRDAALASIRANAEASLIKIDHPLAPPGYKDSNILGEAVLAFLGNYAGFGYGLFEKLARRVINLERAVGLRDL